MHIIVFYRNESIGNGANAVNSELCRNRLTNAKTSVSLRVSLRLNEFLSKNDVNALKRVISRKKRVLCTLLCFNAVKALGMVQMHRIMQKQAN